MRLFALLASSRYEDDKRFRTNIRHHYRTTDNITFTFDTHSKKSYIELHGRKPESYYCANPPDEC